MTIRAIETRYKGYRFRSRLEARWAVFFDAIKAEWEYEKEGYNVNGTWYLPDFWFPHQAMKEDGWGYWLEIKPTPLDESQVNLLAELARLSGHRTFAVCGNPWPGEHKVYVFRHHHHGQPHSIPFVVGELSEHVDQSEKFGVHSVCLRIRDQNCRVVWSHFVENCDFWWGKPGSLLKAFEAARSARFEHGEAP